MRIGVDTGGTFTDLVLLDGASVVVHKVRSTPDDPSRAIITGIQELAPGGSVRDVVHGSTVATNAVLERRGARVALVATAGFEDVLRIGRQTRRELYNFMVEDRRPLVEDGLTFGLCERLAYDGAVVEPLEDAAIDRLVEALAGLGVDAVAVCLLHSYVNPAHEQRVASRLSEAGFVVSASHAVLPEYREFERWSTTVVNAYVTPLMARYLSALEAELGGARLSIMQSNGGSISAARAKAASVQTILSGPAAGAVGARTVAEAAGFTRIIGFDMGGTSTDVTLINGELGMTTESTVGDFPVRLPMIDIHTVGAGGGSIAYLDSGGALRVGPRSAGADPGPVCYGKGEELTVTDANLLLGRLEPEFFLGGRMALDVERTRHAADRFAPQLGLTVLQLAEGIVRVANANMERAIRVVSVQRGFDPRDFALLAFGGAGGMHACAIAETLDISTVIAPRHAGVLSALGMLLADVTKDYSLTILRLAHETPVEDLKARFDPLAAQATGDLAAEGFTGPRAVVERSLDVRYVGQAYEITVPFTADFREEFDRRHARLYGYSNPKRPAEVVNLRVRATGLTDKPSLPRDDERSSARVPPVRVRPACFDGAEVATAVYHHGDLPAGTTLAGPAVVIGKEATTVIPPAFRLRVDGFGNLIATRGVAAKAARRAGQTADVAV
ncbi:MAG: hydantoinase/oxoprolinase family protein [Gemmatimonadaceae bacterium]|nr:hydantoinase/oxoprolinase family protein [Gemmatimonadaceae bacterium]